MQTYTLAEVALALPEFEKPVAFDSISRQELHELLVAHFVELVQSLDIPPQKLIFSNNQTLSADFEEVRALRYQIALLHRRIAESILAMPSVQAAEVPGSTIPVYLQRTIEDCFNLAVRLCVEA